MKNRHTAYLSKFGKRLRAIRIEKSLSQEQLANDADIPLQQVGRIERAEINTTLSTIKALADALEVSPKELMDFD